MRKIFAGAVAVVIGAVALPASAQTAAGTTFGTQGQFAIDAQGGEAFFGYPWGVPVGGGAGGGARPGFGQQYGLTPFIGWSFRNSSQPDNGADHQDNKQSFFYINPGVDYFVIDHLSLGGEVVFGLLGTSTTFHVRGQPDRSQDGPGATLFGIMPRVGYDIPIGSMFSLWPRGGIGFQHISVSGGGVPDSSATAWFFYADVYFMFHFVEHFFFGVGPGLTVSLSSSATVGGASGDNNKYTDIRLLSFVIGGYI
jgi:hypothetical protein